MPTYEFSCPTCGTFEHYRPFKEASDPMLCPNCKGITTRIFSPPGLYKTSTIERITRARNERSAEEPRVEKLSPEEIKSLKKHHPSTRHRHIKPPWTL